MWPVCVFLNRLSSMLFLSIYRYHYVLFKRRQLLPAFFYVQILSERTFTQPFPHAVYWTESGFFGAIYGPEAGSTAAGEWEGQNPGRMELNHDNRGKNLEDGDSATITYYVAFGVGGEKEGDELANEVQKEPSIGEAVSPLGSLTNTWGRVRAGL